MLTVSHVSKSYGKFKANDDIDLQVRDGEIAVLLGPNGAGKSTIIKCITGLLRYDGHIEINGNANKTDAARRMLGYVPEMPAVYDLLTVGEHLEFIRLAYRLEEQAAEAYAGELMERFELIDKKDNLGK